MLSIGEFSRATRLTIKTLRLYHEKGLLVPARVDPETGYRYYDRACLERARAIAELRKLDVSLAEIAGILVEGEDEPDVLAFLQRHRERIGARVAKDRAVLRRLDGMIRDEEAASMEVTPEANAIQEKTLEPVLVAGIRVRGRYSDCGAIFGKLCRAVGRYVRGKPMNLYHDAEYKEEDADFEPCVPVRPGCRAEGVSVHELPGGRCVTLLHRGPYEELGRSYAAVFEYIRSRGFRALPPGREVYIKGPGMIFRGNPKKYLTEIQILVEGPAGGQG